MVCVCVFDRSRLLPRTVGLDHKETERQRDRETERQRDRETERQRDRETGRERQGEEEEACLVSTPSIVRMAWHNLLFLLRSVPEE
jgi:hypothetical protein